MEVCRYCNREGSPIACAAPVYKDGEEYPYICSRIPGHSGDHMACGGEGLHELAVSSNHSEEDTSRMTRMKRPTPAEEAGWKVGDVGYCNYPSTGLRMFNNGERLQLIDDDGTSCPLFYSPDSHEEKFEELKYIVRENSNTPVNSGKNIRPFAWHFSDGNDSVQIDGDKLTIVVDNEVTIPYESVNNLVDAILEAKRHMDYKRFKYPK